VAVLGKSRNTNPRERDVVTRLRHQIEAAINSSTNVNQQRATAWRQFAMEPNGTEDGARSAIQSADVNTMVSAIMAQMVISFSTDTVVSYEANSAEDEQAAAMESRAVNRVVVEQNGGYQRLLDAAQNALLYRTAYVKVWWADDIDQFVLTVENVEREEVPILVESEVGTQRRLVSWNPETKKARIDVTKTNRRLSVAAVDNGLFFIDPDHDEKELASCNLCGEILYKSRDELSRMGVPWAIVKELPAVQKWSQEQKTNRRRGDRWNAVEPIGFQNDICRVFEAYARFSFDEDADRATLYKCFIGDKTKASFGFLLEPVPVSRVPYAAGSAFPIANRHQGESLAEKLYSIQEAKTELMRQWLDNVQVNSIGRYGAVVGQVEIADIMTPKAGQPIRMKSPSALLPIPVNDVGASIGQALMYLDQQREERGGAALDMVGSEQQLAQETAAGTERVYASKELMVSYMMRNISETLVKQIYMLGHAELRDGENGPVSVKYGEKWIEVDPATWPARAHCNVKVGYSMGERRQIANTLFSFIQLQTTAMQAGLDGQLVSKQGLYKSTVDWLNVSLVDNPEAYLIDPSSEQAQQAAQQAAAMAQQQAQAQQELLALPERIKAASAQYKVDADTLTTMFKAVLEATVKANTDEVQGNVEVIRAATEAKVAQATLTGSADGAGEGNGGRGANGSGGKSRANGTKSGTRDSAN